MSNSLEQVLNSLNSLYQTRGLRTTQKIRRTTAVYRRLIARIVDTVILLILRGLLLLLLKINKKVPK